MVHLGHDNWSPKEDHKNNNNSPSLNENTRISLNNYNKKPNESNSPVGEFRNIPPGSINNENNSVSKEKEENFKELIKQDLYKGYLSLFVLMHKILIQIKLLELIVISYNLTKRSNNENNDENYNNNNE